ncbi:PKD domain-containing protein [Blastococcus litoris]|uniref:PKD domain-containing protein n=1 Tax=Blastococcus litoris TaxID=2171622 RepID=UPI000E303D51|nr:PKD domain-containing protein [Blastococcus litoris]
MYGRVAAWPKVAVAGLLSTLLAIGTLGTLLAGTAQADTAPADPANPATPATVSADPLPTVQIDGVAWSQVVVGNTVYVGGEFTTARPAGAAPGVNTVPRNNLLAYDIRTGELITSFAPSLNAQVKTVAASPDGTRIYVGGSFTVADGQPRYRIAAYDTATGQLATEFTPGFSQQVKALAVTNDAVYVGGNFTWSGTETRTRLAAYSRSNGALLPWAPAADAQVQTLAVSPDASKVYAGGSFTKLTSPTGASQTARGLGAIDAVTGEPLPFTAGTVINNTGSSASVTGISVDADTVYASGYTYGPGTLEGVVAADVNTGAVKWIDDCHGDTYSVWASGTSAYVAGHPHVCSNIGGFPQTEPWSFYRGIAFSKAAVGKVGTETGNFVGQPAPQLLTWFPDIKAGTYTGQSQGPWNVSGNSQYVVYGGEFPGVDGVAQQGLVRFAVRPLAPNKVGPDNNPELQPVVRSVVGGTARVTWQATHDQDNEILTYRVYRDGNTTVPVYEVTQASTFWKRPTLSFVDGNLTAGSHRYRVTASDPLGNVVSTPWTTVEVGAPGTGGVSYADNVLLDGAQNHWRLGEASGTVAEDSAGTSDLAVRGSTLTPGRAGAISGDPDTAIQFYGQSNNGTPRGFLATTTAIPGPNEFTIEAWFQTTSRTGGKIIGFGNRTTGNSTGYDRHVYMDASGRVLFGVYPGQERIVNSTATFNDGKWHHVAASLSPSGMALYVDGVLVGSRTDTTVAQAYTGYWRVGGDSSWSGNAYFTGLIDEPAVYPQALPADRVRAHYTLGTTGKPANMAPTATFTSTVTDLAASFDAASSLDTDGTIASYAWDFGDQTSGTGATAQHTYAQAGTYTVRLTVTDDKGATGTTTRQVTATAPRVNEAPTAAFTTAVTDLAVRVDGSGSADTDGTIASYAWDFGDQASGTGATAQHTYAQAGTYTVRLTVTDDKGATGTTTRQVTVTDPPAGPRAVAQDAFERSVASGLGTADAGGDWTTGGWTGSASVSGGAGHVAVARAGGRTNGTLSGVSSTEVAVQTSLALPQMPTGGGIFFSVDGRRSDAGYYRATVKVNATGSVNLILTRGAGGTETGLRTIKVPGLDYTPGTVLNVRFDVSGVGTSTLAAKVWAKGTPEPAGWQNTVTDTTAALQAAGTVGYELYVSGSATALPVVLDLDDFWAGPAGTTPADTAPPVVEPPANTAPTAAFVPTVTGMGVAVDATSSSDADGTIAAYAWDFGDQTSGTGATAQHTYAQPGTYTIRLTVTDDDGATGTRTQEVTVAQPGPAPEAFALDAFGRSVATGLGTADTGGDWTTGGWTGSASVSDGAAHIAVARAGGRSNGYLDSVSADQVAVQLSMRLPQMPTGGGIFFSTSARHTAAGEYRATTKVTAAGGVNLILTRVVGGVETNLRSIKVGNLTYTPGMVLNVRFDVSGVGTSTLGAKVWADGTAEPAEWQTTATDAAPELQVAGSVGFELYVSGSATALPLVLDLDDLWVGRAGTGPVEE